MLSSNAHQSQLARRAVGVLAAAALAAVGMTAAAQAQPAPAQPAPAGSTIVRAGLKPIHPTKHQGKNMNMNTLTVGSNATQGAVSPHPTVYLVFWGKQWSTDPASAEGDLQAFFNSLHGAPDTYDSIFTQYCEGVPTGTSNCGASGTHIVKPASDILAGVWKDNAKAAPTNATAAQLAAEVVKAAGHFGNTTQAPNTNAQYVIASAHGTHPDGFPGSGFCGYHSWVGSAYGTLAWTNLPYVPDLGKGACTTISNPSPVAGYFSTETHEYSETLTDFWPNIGWNGGNGEIGDECVSLDSRITLPSGTYDVQGEWSNAKNKCVTTG